MNTQTFIPSDYAKFDPYKHIILKHLKDTGWDAEINKDQYGVDIVAFKEGLAITIDVEVKNYNWTSEVDFPFSTVHFTNRKKKFQEEHFYYFLISKNKKGCIYQAGNVIYGQGVPVKKFNRRSTAEGYEVFYELKKDNVKFIYL